MRDYGADALRNICLLSHGGAGKTSLSEAILYTAGVTSRLGRVDDGNTVSDYDPDEIKRKISINLSVLPFEWKNTKVNILDAPGYMDFLGEVSATLRVADSAAILVCATAGVEVGTEQVWKYVEAAGLPRLIIISKTDRENADFFRTLEAVQKRFGKHCIPLQLPIGAQNNFKGVIDLINLKGTGIGKGEEIPIPPEMQQQVDSYKEKLIEAVAERDDALITKYLEGGEISIDEIRQVIKKGIADCSIVPVLVVSGLQNIGVNALLDTMVDYMPSVKDKGAVTAANPANKQEESLPPDSNGPLAALVFKTTADPYVGKLNYFRVYSGIITSNSQVWNANKGQQERIGQLYIMRGKNQEAVPQLVCGDIGAVAKLGVTSTNDTLCQKERALTLVPVKFPSPIYNLAIVPKTKADLDKLGTVLARITEEDQTIKVSKESSTNETILSGLGETHIEVVTERMQRKFGVDVKVDVPRIPYRETITIPVKTEYKHRKQTGGHGQYGHVMLEMEPLERGKGFEFEEKVFGGAIPRNYFPAVEKGVNEALQEGIIARYPVADIKVTLCDGSFHPVDSSEICFKIAGAQAFKKGLAQGQPILLEPIMRLKVTVPEEFTGDIMGNLNSRRARVLGMMPEGSSVTVESLAPLAEVQRYAIDLKSLTQGRGIYSMEFDHYEEVPAYVTQKIKAEREAEKAAKE